MPAKLKPPVKSVHSNSAQRRASPARVQASFDALCAFWLSVVKGAVSRGGGNRSARQEENK